MRPLPLNLAPSVLIALAMLCAPSPAAAQTIFAEDFEGTSGETYTADTASLTGAPEWSFDQQTPEGRLRMNAGAGYARSGVAAATLDRNPSGGFQTNFLILTLDLSALSVATDALVLDFSFMHHGEESHADDRVWVRGSNTSAFIEVFNLNAAQGTSGTYRNITDVDVSGALAAAGQDFSSTFQVRFGQHDDFPSTSLTVSDGFTFDDITIRRLPAVDMAALAIVSPASEACGEPAQDVVVQIQNLGSVPASDITITVDVTGDFTDTLTAQLAGPLAPDEITTVALGPLDTLDGGEAFFTATVSVAGEEVPANNSVSSTSIISSVELSTVAAPTCPGSPALLTVDPIEPGVIYEWYTEEVDGELIGVGELVPSPPLTADATFYGVRESSPERMGAADEGIGAGSYHTVFENNGLVFDVAKDTVLRSVSVIPRSAGVVRVRVRDAAGEVIGSVNREVTSPDEMTPIELNLAIPAGTGYRIDAVGTNVALFRNTEGAEYPYAGSRVVIQRTISPFTPGYYYFFYDWLINGEACASVRTPVVATVDVGVCDVDAAVEVMAPETVVAGRSLTYTITVKNNGFHTAVDTTVDFTPVPGVQFTANAGDCATEFPCALGSLGGGEQRTITSRFRVAPGFALASGLAAMFTVTHTAPEGTPGDESAVASTAVLAEADLGLSMQVSAQGVAAGEPVTFTLTVENRGPSDARDVVITDQLPAGVTLVSSTGCAEDPNGAPTCTVGVVPAGSSAQVQLQVTASDAGTITNTAEVSSSATEIVSGDEIADAAFTVERTLDGTGCGCRAGAPRSQSNGAWLLAAIGAAIALRRRRRPARS